MDSLLTQVRFGIMSIGICISSLLGGLDQLLFVLIAFSAADYLTGIMKAIIDHQVSSTIGAKGIFRKISIYVLVAVGNSLDQYILHANGTIRSMVILFYLSNEGISILENISNLGLPIPAPIRDVLIQLSKTK